MRLRLMGHVMSRRFGETLDCLIYLTEETLWRKFSVFEELAWKR